MPPAKPDISLNTIYSALGELRGDVRGVTAALTDFKSACLHRHSGIDQRLERQSSEMDALRNGTGRMRVQMEAGKVKWALLFKTVGLLAGGGGAGALLQYLMR